MVRQRAKALRDRFVGTEPVDTHSEGVWRRTRREIPRRCLSFPFLASEIVLGGGGWVVDPLVGSLAAVGLFVGVCIGSFVATPFQQRNEARCDLKRIRAEAPVAIQAAVQEARNLALAHAGWADLRWAQERSQALAGELNRLSDADDAASHMAREDAATNLRAFIGRVIVAARRLGRGEFENRIALKADEDLSTAVGLQVVLNRRQEFVRNLAMAAPPPIPPDWESDQA